MKTVLKYNPEDNTISIVVPGARPSKDQTLVTVPPQPFYKNKQVPLAEAIQKMMESYLE